MNTINVVKDFISKINNKDIDAITSLMGENHVFVDSLGNTVRSRENNKQVWEEYLEMFPDYQITTEKIIKEDNLVIVIGKASGTYTKDGHLYNENYWEIPAVWRVLVVNNKIEEWQIFTDNDPVREIMRNA